MDKKGTLLDKVLKCFEKLSLGDGTEYKCNIGNCTKVLNGKYSSNLLKHVRRVHENFFKSEIQARNNDLTMQQKRLKLIQDWVEIVTVNGRSFLHLADSGFQKVADEKLAELDDAGLSAGLNAPNFIAIKENISYLADEVKKKIKEEINGKFVSLMIDFATKHRKSIMGVNCIVKNGKIISRSIGMVQSLASNTCANVLNILIELLNSFGIEKSRVISITTDNAPNLTLMVKIFNENLEREKSTPETHDMETNASAGLPNLSHDYFSINDIDDEIRQLVANCHSCEDSESDDELDAILNDEYDFEALIRSLGNKYGSHTTTVNGIKCAAHTLQLAVRDALGDKALNIKPVIELCRIVCKTLRTQSYLYILEENGFKIKSPRLDCLTRWSSMYNMVRKHALLLSYYVSCYYFFKLLYRSTFCCVDK